MDHSTPDVAGTSIYVHVPFCVVKCGYCDFNSYVVEGEAPHDRFLAALTAEMRLAAMPTKPVSVFVGGGTPSLLSPTRLRQLLGMLGERIDLRACTEVTMEVNPESMNAEKASIALELGVTRFSMGVQSFDASVLRFLDRAHTGDRARQAFMELREAGAKNVSVDLIFGVPGQSAAVWQLDLTTALGLGPDHVSCYNLVYEPGTRLTHALERGEVARNDEETDRELFLWTRDQLTASGFAAYEISNFAGPGGRCRHNDHYWLQGDYVGLGPGASSHRAGVRSTNLKALEAWAASAMAGVPPFASAETLSPHQRAGEAVWLGIRRAEGVDLAEIELRTGVPMQTAFGPLVDDHVRRGLLTRAADRIALTEAGILLADAVGSAFLVTGGAD